MMRRFFSVILHSLTVLGLILSLLAPGGLFFIPMVHAATAVTMVAGGANAQFPGSPIKASSAATALAKISLTASAAAKTLTSVRVDFSGTGFATTDLADLATGNTSGVALYDDTGGTAGAFDGTDAVITLAANPAWSSNSFTLTPATAPTLTSGSAVIFYVVIKTSATIASADVIAATIPANGVVTSDGNGPTADFIINSYRADTAVPTITEVRAYAGSASVTVRFSEPVQKVGTGNIAFVSSSDPFTFTDNGTDGGTVITAVSHSAGQDFATLTMDENSDSGDFADTLSTLAAASNKIMDMAGNVMGNGAVNFSSPLNITTASIPSTYVGANHPSTSTLVTFAASGGVTAYSFTADGSSTTTLSNLGLSLATNGKLTATSVANRTGSYAVTIKVTDSTGGTPLTAIKQFTINVAASNGAGIPGLNSVSPAGLAQSATSTLTITGVNTHFASGSSAVAFSLPVGQAGTNGVTVNSVTVVSATSIYVAVTIAGNATSASRDITVTTGTEVATMPNAFGVFSAGASGLTLLFPSDGGTNVQLPPPFTFNPSTNANLNSYRVTVKSSADFSGTALWDYVYPKPSNAQNANGSHCTTSTCSLTYGAGAFRILTQPAALSPNTTYYWQVRTYSQTMDNVISNTAPLEFTAARGFTTVTSITDTTPPGIMHRPVFSAPASANLDLLARVMDNVATVNTSPALTTKIFYCAGSGCDPTTEGATPTNMGGGYFKYRIPSATISSAGTIVRYYLQASDGTNTYSFKAAGNTPFQLTSVASGNNTIAGTVKDSAGTCTAGVRQATIFAEGTGFSTTSSNDANCTYTLSNLIAGTYDLVAFKDGYAERIISGIPAGSTDIGFRISLGMGGGFGGDTTKPRVKFNAPMDGMTGIPGGDSNTKVFVVFDKAMSQSTFSVSGNLTVNEINLSTGALTDITTTKGAWTYYSSNPGQAGLPAESNMAVWALSGNNTFGDGKTIAVVVTPNVTDTAGNAIQGNTPDGSYSFSFTTGSTANFSGFNNTTGAFSGGGTFGSGAFVPPHVIGTTPTPGSSDVPRNAKIVINFSDAMADDAGDYLLKNFIKLYTVSGTTETDVSTAAIDTVTLDSVKKNATVGLKSTYNSGTFSASTSYNLRVLGGAKSATSITLAPPNQSSSSMYQLGFKTSAVSDTAAPTILGTFPDNAATSVPVNVGAVSVGFSKDMDASTITNSAYYLSVGSTAVNGSVEYKSVERQAYFIPSAALTPNTTYTINLTASVKGLNGAAIAAITKTFTTGAADSAAPNISFVNADDYNLAITFSEPMNAAKATDSINFTASVIKVGNFAIKYGAAGFASNAGTSITIPATASLSYDSTTNTVIIEGYHNADVTDAVLRGQEILVTVTGVKDLSGNAITTAGSANTGRGTIGNSATTKGALGPMAMSTDAFSGGGGFRPDNFSSDTFGFAPSVEVRPFNMMAGQTTNYGVRLPVSKQIPAGGSIVLTFPTGFDVSGAKQDINSPMRTDLNGPGTDTPTFKCTTATGGTSCGGGATVTGDDSGDTTTKGGLADDGVVVNTGSRTVTVYLSAATNTEGHDFLTIDLAGIKNSTVPKDFNTSGYTVDIKTKNAAGSTVLESLTSKSFFIQSAGSYTLSGTITATGATAGTMKIYLMSPMTGPMEATSAAFNAGSAAYTFSNLPNGEFMLFTDQVNSLTTAGGAKDFTGKAIPERVKISGNTTYNFTIANATTGGTNVTINIDGPSATALDIFAGSPAGFKTKQVTLDSSAGAEAFTINLADGTYFVGVGPQMPKGPMSGPPPTPSYLPPQPKEIKVTNPTCSVNGTAGCSATFTLTASNRTIKGVVKDGSSKVIANAEVYAYSPSGGMGTHATADSIGAFTLNVIDGVYVVGAFVPGMPPSKEVPVTVNSDTTKGGHATNYLFIDSSTTGIAAATAATSFVLKVAKPDYTISGQVTDGTNAIQGASVYAYRTDGPGHANSQTDSSGKYTLYVANGTWKVGSFLPQYGNLTELTVTISGSSASSQNFSPSGTGTFYAISGRVYKNLNGDADYDSGEELQGVFVKLEGNGAFNETISGSDGTFSFKAASGTGYRLRAFDPNIGELPATASFNVAADVTDKDIVVTTPRTVTVTFSSSVTEAYVEAFASTGVGNRTRITNSTTGALSLPNGDYTIKVNLPGMVIGLTDIAATDGTTTYSSTTGVFTVDSAEGLTVTLPTLKTVSGTVTDGTNNISDAWVEISNPTTGIHFGTKSGSDGTFSLQVKSLTTYTINAMKPGYFRESSQVTVGSSNVTAQTLTLSTASRTIAGQIKIGSSGASNAFVRAERQGGGFAGTQADTNGNYTLSVNPGTWRIFAVADGYSEAAYASNPIDVNSASASGKDITLSSSVTMSAPKSKSITPASGGTLDDTTAGITLTIPANALGSDTSAGNIQAKETNNVRATGSARPIKTYDSTNSGYVAAGKEITATDSTGTSINTLNDSATVAMTYTLAELSNTSSDSDSSINTKSESDKLKMAYWDETTANWVTLSSTVTYKNSSGDIITDSTTIDTAAEFAATVATVVIAADTTHFSLYAPVVATDALAPATPGGLSATAQTTTDIALSWSQVSGATSYDIYRSTASDGTFSRLGSEPTVSSGSTTSYADHNLAVGTTYYYKITSLNSSGESAASSAVNATTNSAASSNTGGGGGSSGNLDYTAPTISGITFTVSKNGATIKWTTGEASLTWLMYGLTTAYGQESKSTDYKTAHEVVIANLAANTIYHFTVKSQDSGANVATYSDQLLQTTGEGSAESSTTTVSPAPATSATPSATAKTTTATFTVLKLGSKGAAVTKLQNFLIQQKHLVIPAGMSKGNFASLTKAALKKFQQANGLAATGELNEATQAKIDQLSGTAATVAAPKSSSAPKASAAELEGKAVKSPNSAAIYLIQNGVKKPFTSEMMFFSYGFKWTDVKTYDLSEISAGENMVYSDSHTFTSGQMLKGEDNKVYFIDQAGLRHWIEDEATFLGLGYQWSQVAWISNTALAKYPVGSSYSSAATRPDGSLIKYPNSDKVYVLEEGKKRWIANEQAFNGRKYGWYNIIIVPATEQHETGADLTS